jgi:hypothetical protein
MANTVIAIRSSGVTGNSPSLGVLANGELSLNFADGVLYYKTSANTLGSIYKVQPSGLTTEVQFNDSGSFGGNSSFTFNKTTSQLNVTNLLVNTNLTTGSGVGGIIAGANVIYANTFVANTGGYIQFSDGSRQYTANAGALSNNQILTGLQTVSATNNITFDYVATANNGFGQNFKVGDDVWIGDTNVANTLRIKGQQDAANAYIMFGNNDGVKLGREGSGALTYTGAFTATGLVSGNELTSTNSSGNEGGQVNLALPATNTTLNGSVVIDVYQNRLRFYEGGGSARGAYIDLTAATGGVGFNLLSGGGGGGSTNSFGTILANGVSIIADQANEQVEFVGESGIFIGANTTTNKVVIAGTPGAQGLTVDYGWVTESINYSIDYGTL